MKGDERRSEGSVCMDEEAKGACVWTKKGRERVCGGGDQLRKSKRRNDVLSRMRLFLHTNVFIIIF